MSDSPTTDSRLLNDVASLFVCTVLLSWFGMQAIHELGHVIAAWTTGGGVDRVVLHPLTISRTDIRPNPDPLTVVWSGPIIGCVIPVLLWLSLRNRLPSLSGLIRFWAGFSLIANGCYIGAGVLTPVGDAEAMLRQGSHPVALGLFGALTVPLGLWLWNGISPVFVQRSPQSPSAGQIRGIIILTVTVTALLFLLGGR